MKTSRRKLGCGGLAIFLCLLLLCGAVITRGAPGTGQIVTSQPTTSEQPNQPSPASTKSPYVYLSEQSHVIYADRDIQRGNGAGVKVYMGKEKTYVFEIIGGADCPSMPSGKSYLVRYEDGEKEWKDKEAMENAELFVFDNVSSLVNRDWIFYSKCQ